MYVNRDYRNTLTNKDMKSFRVTVKETDLYISVDAPSYVSLLEKKIENLVLALRYDLEEYIVIDKVFKSTLRPHALAPGAPLIARTMADAARVAGVGPMAAVAGAFAEAVGSELLKTCNEVIVENGGDIFMRVTQKKLVAVFAGRSPFTGRLAIEVAPEKTPLGICTSSGTVGPSFSMGAADAVIIISDSAPLSDAAASASGNAVKDKKELKKGIQIARKIPGVLGAVVIKDDKLAVWGDVDIIPLSPFDN
ncbi:UPF0280 family protein [Phosphitispora sp. TUW77]|uniref:UPF0280 family protein n=1 Tax=Phosphitispora sp. TUW77 TaxID=3152361 RepID=UPI003AB4F709